MWWKGGPAGASWCRVIISCGSVMVGSIGVDGFFIRSSAKSAPNVEDAWIEDFYGGTGPIVDLGVAPSNPDICFATDHCPRSFRTLDGVAPLEAAPTAEPAPPANGVTSHARDDQG